DPGGRHPGERPGDGDPVLLARHRQAGDRQHLRPRLSDRAGHRAHRGVFLHAGQPGGRPGLRLAQPADQLRVSAVGGASVLEPDLIETAAAPPVSVRRLLRTYPRLAVAATLLLRLALIALLAPWIAL